MRTLLATLVVAALLLLPVLTTPRIGVERSSAATTATKPAAIPTTGPTYLNATERTRIANRARVLRAGAEDACGAG